MNHIEKQLASELTSLTKSQKISNEQLLKLMKTQNELYLESIKQLQSEYQNERKTILEDIIQTNKMVQNEYLASAESLKGLSQVSDEISVSTRQQIEQLKHRLKMLETWQKDSGTAISNLVELLSL